MVTVSVSSGGLTKLRSTQLRRSGERPNKGMVGSGPARYSVGVDLAVSAVSGFVPV
jgi:hypothetical protein